MDDASDPGAPSGLPTGWTWGPAEDSAADELVALVAGAYAEYDGCVLDPEGVDRDLFAWASHLAVRGGEGWFVRDTDGHLVACVGAAPVDGGAVELKRLYVDATARRRGLGALLVGHVHAWAASRGADRVVLWSDTRFADAHRLYERLGHERTGRRRDLHDPSATTEDEFMRRIR